MNDKTLVILAPGFAANEEDSTCLPAQQEFVLSVKRIFTDLHIIILAFQYPFFASEYDWHGVKIISFNGRNRGRFRRLFLWRRVLKKLYQLRKRHQIIGLLSFWYGECAFIGEKFAHKNKVTHYCWILGQDARTGNKYVKRTALKEEQLVAMSDFLASEFCRNYGIRPRSVVTNGIPLARVNNSNKERIIDIIGVGSLIDLKRYDLFIECVAALKKQFPDINAVICGDGPEKARLEQLVEERSLQKNVSFQGELPHSEVLRLMEQSKILLHPSSYEGFSTVCLEALGAGAHVVSYTKPMRQSIPHWHIEIDIDGCKATLNELVSDASLDHKAVVPFTMEGSARKMIDLFLRAPC